MKIRDRSTCNTKQPRKRQFLYENNVQKNAALKIVPVEKKSNTAYLRESELK